MMFSFLLVYMGIFAFLSFIGTHEVWFGDLPLFENESYVMCWVWTVLGVLTAAFWPITLPIGLVAGALVLRAEEKRELETQSHPSN